jgi:endoglucanase
LHWDHRSTKTSDQKLCGTISRQNKAVRVAGMAMQKPGVAQTASVRSPYIYAEDDWMDDMELAV